MQPRTTAQAKWIKQNNGWTRQAHNAKVEEGELIRHIVSVTKDGCSLQQDPLTHFFWLFWPYYHIVSSCGNLVCSVVSKLVCRCPTFAWFGVVLGSHTHVGLKIHAWPCKEHMTQQNLPKVHSLTCTGSKWRRRHETFSVTKTTIDSHAHFNLSILLSKATYTGRSAWFTGLPLGALVLLIFWSVIIFINLVAADKKVFQ